MARRKNPRATAERLLALVEGVLDDGQAIDSSVIDLNGKTSIADFMVVASGRNPRHLNAMADHLIAALKKTGLPKVRVEGQSVGDWVLIDAGDIIIHLFRPDIRRLYGLEKMWALEIPQTEPRVATA
ncbi:MAG: ribosome silencing factor [Proteobacteria bacterium]|nr:ribosome silencing factor [Pseudomonadota bacterium]MBI3499514.1 ribosome silencing factor [Pseudomonadota bacterium]